MPGERPNAQEIATANRFAGLALCADKVARTRRGESEVTNPDLLYLHAVTFRYMISTVETHLTRSAAEKRRAALVSKGVDQAKLFYGQALTLIEHCITIHFGELDMTDDPAIIRRSRLRYLRALSERAALNPFMTTSLGLAARNGPSSILLAWHEYLYTARGDLWRCVKMDDYDIDDKDPLLAIVRAQFIPNLAAYEVLSFVLVGDEYKMEAWPRKMKKKIRDFRKLGQDIHPLLSAELAGYFLLSGEAPIPAEWLRRSSKGQDLIRLPLDKILYATLSRDIPRPLPSPRHRR